ncbi:MAG TPA: acyltransferase domain-containing protein, partial [Polyangiaceae bacterium]|nr:acyltransferase domain-containing protein [Polyangiaceae bacterium]
AMWRSFGVEPDLVLGHSVGEYAAAVAAGVLRWQDALRILAARGRAMARLGERGAMLSVRASEARLAERVAELGLDLAAVNAAEQVVVAGPEGALGRLAEWLKEEGVEAKRLRVSHAFHSRLLEPMLDELEAAFAGVELAAPGKTLLSNLSGAAAGSEVATARYWREHTRRPVRFADSARSLRAAGVDAVVEIGPHATLLAFLADAEPERPLPAWPSLRRGRPEWATLLSAVAGLYERGAAVDFARLDAPYVRRKISAPTYAFERARHWVDSLPRAAGETGVRGAAGGLVGAAVATPNALHHVVPVGPSHQPWLADHLVRGRLVAPGALSLAAVLAVAAERLGATQATLRDVELPNPLFAEDAELHVVLTPAGEGEYDFATSTREERGGEG